MREVSSMEELVEILARALVDQPENVTVNTVQKNGAEVIQLKVAPEDAGKVIGKQGRIARAIRTVVRAAAVKANKKVIVEIL